jgi:hypothetical protein
VLVFGDLLQGWSYFPVIVRLSIPCYAAAFMGISWWLILVLGRKDAMRGRGFEVISSATGEGPEATPVENQRKS